MAQAISDEDEGKAVVNADGERIGRIVDVRGDRAYVDPDPSITDTVKSKLGWGEADADDYPLQESAIEGVTDDEIRLRRDF